MSNYISLIIGFSFFAISEILPLLPIPANGLLHSLVIGIKNSVSTNLNTDVEIAQSLIQTKPEMANIVSTIQGNFKLTDTIKLLNSKPQLIQYVEKLAYDKNLQFINTLLLNNQDSINDLKILIVDHISKKIQNSSTQLSTQPQLNSSQITQEQIIPEQINIETPQHIVL